MRLFFLCYNAPNFFSIMITLKIYGFFMLSTFVFTKAVLMTTDTLQAAAVNIRRTFAIISHPNASK